VIAASRSIVVFSFKLPLNLAVDIGNQRSCNTVRNVSKGCVKDLELFLSECECDGFHFALRVATSAAKSCTAFIKGAMNCS
jgi:hypothetical protein